MPSNIVIIGSIEASLGFPNTWTALQTFKAGVVATTIQAELNQSTLNGIPFLSSTPTSGQVLSYNGTGWLPASVPTSVSNSDGTLTISPTTGAVVASLNLAHANTWSAVQTFGNNISIGGVQFNIATLSSGQYIYYNGTNWVNVTPITGTTLTETSGQLALNLANANSWTATQTFSGIAPNAAQSTLSGTTAGTITYNMPFIGASYKKFVAYASGYENDTTTNQTITFPTAFAQTPAIIANTTGLTISASTTTLTITAPNSTTLYTGWIIIEGW